MRHGRAVIPFGRFKGVAVRQLPDGYLSWLADALVESVPPPAASGAERFDWKWLLDSVLAEMRYRGLRDDRAGQTDAEAPTGMGIMAEIGQKRAICL